MTQHNFGNYILVMGFLVSSVSSFATFFLLTVVQVPMAAALGVPLSLFLGGVALRTLVSVLVAPVAGAFADRPWGPKLMLVAGGLVGGTTVALTSRVAELWQLYALLILTTVALAGTTQLISIVLVSRWFRRNRALAVSIVSMGPSGGSLLLIPLASVALDLGGWQWPWLATGALIALILLPSALLLQRAPAATQSSHRSEVRHWTARQAVRTPALWLLTATCGLVNVTTVGFIFTMPALAEHHAMSGGLKALALTAFPLGTFMSRPMWGFLTQRLPHKAVYYSSLLSLAIAYLAAALADDPLLVVGVGVAVGFAQGANIPLYNVMVADFFGTDSLGSVLGWTVPITSLAQAFGAVIPAVLAERTGTFGTYLFVSALVALGLTALIKAVRRPVFASTTGAGAFT